MRALPLAAFATAALMAAPALATPADVQVNISPALRDRAVKDLGVRDVDRLADDLRQSVERELGRTGVLDGARIELTLVDAKPNRPTFQQMSNRPGLSFESYSIGGARIEGRAVAVDGTVTPIRYAWYETDIRWAPYRVTWSDTHTAFDQFARRLSRGETESRR